ncbi:MAG: 3-phosphoshikimate 1-carboxyvinyltransferase [Spirochaetaceae bacterium]|nr:3-phosphoshikimate 1-carboxyvinyltransferase [Spirochaetaceae bacterium]
MLAIITPKRFTGTVRIPGSKSHTIRRLIIAAMAEGVSDIETPLDSLDARSCAAVCRALGADIEERRDIDPACPNPADAGGTKLAGWRVRGIGGGKTPALNAPLDVGNSGTTLFLALAVAALGDRPATFTGDEQIRRRSAGPLLAALSGLGVRVSSGENGCAPITVEGPWRGGRASLPCPTSQYLSAILLAAPLAPAGAVTEIDVPLLNERPYIELTLSYLDAQGIRYERAEDYSYFRIPGGAAYKPMNGPVPGDFSSAAFPGGAAAVGGGTVTLLGLDPADPQGDKGFFDILNQMGAEARWEQAGEWRLIVSRSGRLRGGEFDLNSCPDLLPIMAVLGAYADGETALVNAAHARIKETDRIAVMSKELGKLGALMRERSDGLIVRGGSLRGGRVDGHGDHRAAMSLAVAGLGAAGPVEIIGAEAADVTYPGFLELLDARCVWS